MNTRTIRRRLKDNHKTVQQNFEPDLDLEGVYFGFDDPSDPDNFMQILSPDRDPVCIVRQVTDAIAGELASHEIDNFHIGTWLISTGHCHETKIHGPFPTLQEAFQHSYKHLGVQRFQTAPQTSE